jgi:hypothetical protein
LELDGHEHVWSNLVELFGYGAEATYSAQTNGSTIDVTTHVKETDRPDHVNVEHWSLTDGGRQMVVTNSELVVPSADLIKFDRAPIARSLFVGFP